MRPGDGRATRAVIRNLWREVKTWNFAWEAHPMTSMEAFRDSASKWLGDKTELSDASIRCADWQEVYEHFLPELEMKRRDDQKERQESGAQDVQDRASRQELGTHCE